jgi:hypothetical protein
MNNPVSFEISKLLKEKGFDEPCSHAYKEVESPILYMHQDKKYNNSFKKEWQNTVRKNSHMDNAVINRYSAPTIAEVIMWLYETHEIWISVDRHFDKFISKNNGVLITFYGNRKSYFDTPTEAYEAAIEYCLTKIELK